MYSLARLMAAYPKHLWLELSPEAQAEAWQQVQDFSNEVARWTAYVNYLCLNAFVSWLQEEPDLPNAPLVWPNRKGLRAIWEVVSGSAIEFEGTRLVLIPSETAGVEEFCVPQEWVDIPRWAGDYYLAVQVKLEDDECWMRVWGFTTHQKLKEGRYNPVNRTYSLERKDLIESLNAMWVAREVCPEEKPAVPPVPMLSEAEAKKLLEQLGKSAPYSPRLEVPFAKWAALLENEEWRQELCRRGLEREVSLPALSQWFEIDRQEVVQAIRAAGWLRYEEVFCKAEAAALARRFRSGEREQRISWVKQIESEMPADYPVALVLNLMREAEGTIWILPQVRPVGSFERQVCLPEGLQLAVLDESGQMFECVKAGSASNLIQLEDWLSDSPRARFSVKIVCGETSITEGFVI